MATNQNFIVRNGIVVQGTANATSTGTGALVVQGGAGIAGDLYVGGNLYLDGVGLDSILGTTGTFKNLYATGTNVSISTTTGALVVSGGVGVGGSLYATELYDSGQRVITTATIGSYTAGVSSIIAGSGINVSSSTGAVTVSSIDTLQLVTDRGFTTTNAIRITNSSASIGTSSGALTVVGGVGIGGNLFVGGNTNLQVTTVTSLTVTGSIINNSGTPSTTTGSGAVILTNNGGLGVGGQLNAGIVKTFDATTATTGGAGSLQVAGGAYIAKNIVVASTDASTGTLAGNALYVAGGVGISNSLVVGGPVLFQNQVIFNGTATYVYSTQTYYTDNILELHVPPGGIGSNWSFDDGKDIGLRLHYFTNSTDTNAALVLANDTKYLEWYQSGAENNTSTFVNAVYGTFKTGNIVLAGTTDASSTTTGALIVTGGAGIGGKLYVSGNISGLSTTDAGLTSPGLSGALQILGGAGVAKNLAVGGTISRTGNILQSAWQNSSGVALNIPAASYQDTSTGAGTVAGPNSASWFGIPTFSSTNAVTYTDAATIYIAGSPLAGSNTTLSNPYALLVGSGNVRIKSTTQATSTSTGALIIDGGIGIAGNTYIGGNLIVNGAQVITTGTIGQSGVSSINAGAGISVSANTGTVTVTNTATLQFVTSLGSTSSQVINLTNTSTSANTNTGQALLVSGGIGAHTIRASNVFDNGNRVITSITPSSGVGIGISSLISSGTDASFVISNLGVNSLATSGSGIGISASTGSVTLTNLGVTSLSGTADQITVTTSTGSVTIGLATSISVTTGTFTQLNVTGTQDSDSTATGALIVTGGVGIGKALTVGSTAANANAIAGNALQITAGGLGVSKSIFVGSTATVLGTLYRSGNITSPDWLASGIAIVSSTATYTATSLTSNQGPIAINALGRPTISSTNSPTYSDGATLYIADAPLASGSVTITNPWALYIANGNVKINSGTSSASPSTGALVVTGGAGIGGNLNVSGTGSFSSNGVQVGASLYTSYTSSAITNTSTQNLDSFSTSTYRTARYTIQILDGSRVHATEMTLVHNNTAVYLNEYGISTSAGEMGSFDAGLVGGSVTLTFTPNYTPSSMIIKAFRVAISA